MNPNVNHTLILGDSLMNVWKSICPTQTPRRVRAAERIVFITQSMDGSTVVMMSVGGEGGSSVEFCEDTAGATDRDWERCFLDFLLRCLSWREAR